MVSEEAWDSKALRKLQDTVLARPGNRWPQKTLAERFWEKVNKNGPISSYRPDLGPCWIWTGQIGKPDGYGKFKLWTGEKWKVTAAHRISYILCVGPIIAGLEADHLCRIRSCANWNHVEIVTHKINSLRGVGICAQEALRTYCPKGHLLAVPNLVRCYFKAGHRVCRICFDDYMRPRNAAAKAQYRARKRK